MSEKYTDTQLLDWLEHGSDGNTIDNIQAIEWKVSNRNMTIRQAVAECLDVEEQDKNECQ